MRAAFIVNARNKAALVGRAMKGALAQTYPCHILLSDQSSDDGTYEEIERTPWGNIRHHQVMILRCPVKGAYGMRACNQHIQWLVEQTDAEWIFQCSADDYSLPDRVKVCMTKVEELARAGKSCVGIATTMLFDDPARPGQQMVSGYPKESGYVSAGVGMVNMAFGSTIWGYRRDWLLKVGLDVPCTLDVYLGFLAACDAGYYVIANPQHVHHMAADLANMGFQGKMRAAEKAGDKAQIARVNELNRYQLFELYYHTKVRQQQLYPLAHAADQNALVEMMLAQAVGWYNERDNLHKNQWTPGVL